MVWVRVPMYPQIVSSNPVLTANLNNMIGLIILNVFVLWLMITEGNIFLRKKNKDGDSTHQSIDL
jgi:hypothetical protein